MNRKISLTIILSLSLISSMHASSWVEKHLGEGTRYAALRTSIVGSQWLAKSPTMQNFAEKHFDTAVIGGVSALALMTGYGLFKANQRRKDNNFDRNMPITTLTNALHLSDGTSYMQNLNPSNDQPIIFKDDNCSKPLGSFRTVNQTFNSGAKIQLEDDTQKRRWVFVLPWQSEEVLSFYPPGMNWDAIRKLIEDFMISKPAVRGLPHSTHVYHISPPLKVIDLRASKAINNSEDEGKGEEASENFELTSDTLSIPPKRMVLRNPVDYHMPMVYPAPSNEPLTQSSKNLSALLEQITPWVNESFLVQLDSNDEQLKLIAVEFCLNYDHTIISIICNGTPIYSFTIQGYDRQDVENNWSVIKRELIKESCKNPIQRWIRIRIEPIVIWRDGDPIREIQSNTIPDNDSDEDNNLSSDSSKIVRCTSNPHGPTITPPKDPTCSKPFEDFIITEQCDDVPAMIRIKNRPQGSWLTFQLPRQPKRISSAPSSSSAASSSSSSSGSQRTRRVQDNYNTTHYPIQHKEIATEPSSFYPPNMDWWNIKELIQNFLSSRPKTHVLSDSSEIYYISPPLKVIDLRIQNTSSSSDKQDGETHEEIEQLTSDALSIPPKLVILDSFSIGKKMVYPAPSNQPLTRSLKTLTSLLDQINPKVNENFLVQLDLDGEQLKLIDVAYHFKDNNTLISIHCDNDNIYLFTIEGCDKINFSEDWLNIKKKLIEESRKDPSRKWVTINNELIVSRKKDDPIVKIQSNTNNNAQSDSEESASSVGSDSDSE